MNTPTELNHVFPLSAGSSEPVRLRAPRSFPAIRITPGFVMGNRAFLRTLAARRLQNATPAQGRSSPPT